MCNGVGRYCVSWVYEFCSALDTKESDSGEFWSMAPIFGLGQGLTLGVSGCGFWPGSLSTGDAGATGRTHDNGRNHPTSDRGNHPASDRGNHPTENPRYPTSGRGSNPTVNPFPSRVRLRRFRFPGGGTGGSKREPERSQQSGPGSEWGSL